MSDLFIQWIARPSLQATMLVPIILFLCLELIIHFRKPSKWSGLAAILLTLLAIVSLTNRISAASPQKVSPENPPAKTGTVFGKVIKNGRAEVGLRLAFRQSLGPGAQELKLKY